MIDIKEKGYASYEDGRGALRGGAELSATAPPPQRSRPHSRCAHHPPPPHLPMTKPSRRNFALSGFAAAATLKADGTNRPLKYSEPPEARKLLVGCKFYVFVGDEQFGEQSSPLSLIPLHFPLPRV